MKTFRLREMENYILERDTVSMEELRKKFNISMNTVRMDVAQLVDKGAVKKVYGGVCSNEKSNLVPFEERQLKNSNKKMAIGKLASSLVQDGDIIYIDSGTTAMCLVEYLRDTKDVTILTNSVNVINRGIPLPNLNIICLSGTLERKTNSFISADTAGILEKYNINKAFMASTGITEDGAVTNSSPLEFEIKKAAIANSKEVYLMIDSDKYGKSALLTYATVLEFDMVVTDHAADPELIELCNKNEVKILYQNGEEI